MNNFPARILLLLFVALWLLSLALVACGGAPAALPTTIFTPQPTVGLAPNGDALQSTPGFQVVLANSHHVVGPDRFAIGLIENGRSVKDATVQVKFFDLNSGDAVQKSQADAPYFGDNLGEAGVYVTRTTFDKPGKWGVEVNAQPANQPAQVSRVGFEVLAKDTVPNIGDAAPRSKNPILKDVDGDRTKICSAVEDDHLLHTMTIADAVASGKPTVILFATPAFCTSRTCGPSLEVVKLLQAKFPDKANFIHIEVYKEFHNFTPADAMNEWHLETEPWVFFVGKDGKIAQRFEGGITPREIEPEFLKFVNQ